MGDSTWGRSQVEASIDGSHCALEDVLGKNTFCINGFSTTNVYSTAAEMAATKVYLLRGLHHRPSRR